MAKKKGDKRIPVILECSDCHKHRYHTSRNRLNTPNKLELSKYCRFCMKVVVHKETK